jgi:hypothetical protein
MNHSKLHYQLGYFALVGLNRLEVLLGDFSAGAHPHHSPITTYRLLLISGRVLFVFAWLQRCAWLSR